VIIGKIVLKNLMLHSEYEIILYGGIGRRNPYGCSKERVGSSPTKGVAKF
jgi:hypothetical protein